MELVLVGTQEINQILASINLKTNGMEIKNVIIQNANYAAKQLQQTFLNHNVDLKMQNS
jgi:hypothetical protein